MLTLIGMTSVADIFDRVAEKRGWRTGEEGEGQEQLGTSSETKDEEKRQWSQIMRSLHQPFEVLTGAMDQGLQHASYTLCLEERPRNQHTETFDGSSPDVESKGGLSEPGDADFVVLLQAKIDRFYEQRKVTLNTWCSQNGISLDNDMSQADSPYDAPPHKITGAHQRQQRQLYLILYMEFLLWSTGRAVLDLVIFADSKTKAGVMKRRRVIVPGFKRIRRWLAASLSVEDANADHAPDTSETRGMSIEIAIAMCTSYLIWYIVNGETTGVIVLLFVFTFCEFYFVLKYPRFIVVALISMITQVMIIGYELQVRKVGVEVAESSGQPAYPLYQLAPYRLACVAGGMLVAFIWTFFPYPLTARSQLRRDLGSSEYLRAKFYVCVHTTVGARLGNSEGDLHDKKSLGRRLDKARARLFTKELALLEGLRQHSAFTAWEPAFGGKFPRRKYDAIIQEVQNILNYVGLISYASNILVDPAYDDPDEKSWISNFRRLTSS
ncbi:MAG: hypothetical protein Q9183_005598, partial [Haloplaca sp. 2 TL-2023]